MRNLVIVRGPQGSGKSHLLRETGLEPFALSPDRMRLALNGPELDYGGELRIPQFRNDEVWKLVGQSFEARLKRGETIALEATFPRRADIDRFVQQAREYRYNILIVDLYGIDNSVLRAQNKNRPSFSVVRDYVIDRTVAAYEPGPSDIPTVRRTSHRRCVEAVKQFISLPVVDLSAYRQIVHIGDIQGCYDALIDQRSPISGGLKDDCFYIFTGDFLDRGPENGKVLRWALDKLVGQDNVKLLRGNHENHLIDFADERAAFAREFNNRTLPLLQAEGIRPRDVLPMTHFLVDVFPYRWGNKNILTCHAGLPNWPESLHLVPGQQCVTGIGHYGDPVDEQFSSWALEHESLESGEFWQVHGHRNRANFPTRAGARSFNLEGQPDFGGHLRFAVLDETGWSTCDVRSRNFRSLKQTHEINAAEGRKILGPHAPLAPWVLEDKDKAICFSDAEIQQFLSHDFVAEKQSETLPHISSLSFTKSAFFTRAWDDVTVKARGLFINRGTNEIVSRSDSKFFNLGEMPETSAEALEKSLQFPVAGYLKENGFLGIAGYDRETDQLILSSKSRIEGEFADIFREIAEELLGYAGLERLYRVLRDQNASAMFEVIDPIRDPHITEYGHRDLVLLNLLHRSPERATMPFKDLQKLGAFLGVRVKERCFEIDNFVGLEAHVRHLMTSRTAQVGRHNVEGLVLEDSSGFSVKVKTGWYSHWKRMRTLKDKILRHRKSGKVFVPEDDDAETLAFVNFCHRQADDVLEKDIITLRKAFLSCPDAIVPSTLVSEVRTPALPDKKLEGFKRGLEAISALISAGKAKGPSVKRIVEQAHADPHKRRLLDEHPLREQFLALSAESSL